MNERRASSWWVADLGFFLKTRIAIEKLAIIVKKTTTHRNNCSIYDHYILFNGKKSSKADTAWRNLVSQPTD